MTEPWSLPRSRPFAPAGVALIAGAGLFAIGVRDPHEGGAWARCPTRWLAGMSCPGCGSLRALHDLATGELAEAVTHNPLVFPALAFLGWVWIAWTVRIYGGSLPAPPGGRVFCMVVLAMFAVYTLTRNVPGAPFSGSP